MSGPKDYAPPPSYSIQVFDGKLNEVFQLQSKLKQLIEELKNSNVEDNDLHINFDCQEALKSIEKQVNEKLVEKGSITPTEYVEIEKKCNRLKAQVKKYIIE